MIKPTGILAAVLVGALCAPAAGQDQETILRAQADMLRKTLERREEEIQRLKEKVAELEQRVAELTAELKRLEGGAPTTAPAEGGEPTDETDEQPPAPDREALVAATQPADADFYGLSRLLRAIPPGQMPGDDATPEARRKFTEWARQTFGGKVLYAMFDVKEVREAADGRRLLIGQAPLPGRQTDRKFFITVVAEVSGDQYARNPLSAGDRAKLLGEMPEQKPLEPIQARITDIREDMLYGKVISRREVKVEINGWSRDYAAVRVRMQRVRVLE